MPLVPLCGAAPPASLLSIITPLLAVAFPFLGVVLGFWWTRRSQIAADTRARLQRETSARSVVFAQLRRISATIGQQLQFIDGPDKMIWLTTHRSLFPSEETLVRLQPLAAPEVDAITSFYYLYQEQVSFLTASAMEVWEPELRNTMNARFNLDSDVMAFDYSTPARKDALVYRLTNIRKSAERALKHVRATIKERKADFPDLFDLLQNEAERLGAYQRPRA